MTSRKWIKRINRPTFSASLNEEENAFNTFVRPRKQLVW